MAGSGLCISSLMHLLNVCGSLLHMAVGCCPPVPTLENDQHISVSSMDDFLTIHYKRMVAMHLKNQDQFVRPGSSVAKDIT